MQVVVSICKEFIFLQLVICFLMKVSVDVDHAHWTIFHSVLSRPYPTTQLHSSIPTWNITILSKSTPPHSYRTTPLPSLNHQGCPTTLSHSPSCHLHHLYQDQKRRKRDSVEQWRKRGGCVTTKKFHCGGGCRWVERGCREEVVHTKIETSQ